MLTPPPVFRSPAPGEKLRVLDFVSLRGAVAGRAERFVADKCRYFETASGVEHRVVVPGAEAGEDRWSESRVHAVASPRLPGAAGARVLIDRARVWEIAAEFQPHVIEVGDPWLAAWMGRGLADARPARIVAVAHVDPAREWARRAAGVCGGGGLGARVGGVTARLATVYSKNLYARMDALVAPTLALAAVWRARGLRQARCVAPGVDTDRFYPRGSDEVAAVRAEWDVPADARVLLYAGRLGREKHMERLVDVFRDLRLANPRQRLRLVVLGDGEAREQVEGWAAVSGGRIRWRARPRSDAALAAAYAAADVFVHPGRGEGFGLSLAEAQACGLPVVVAREGWAAGGATEAALLSLAGNALVDARDGAAWVAAIREALAVGCSPAARTARHGAAKARFAWWHTYERLLGLYRELAGLPDVNRVTGLVRPIGRWG